MHWLQRLFTNQNRNFDDTPHPLPPGAFVNAVRIDLDGGDLPGWIRIVPLGEFPNHHDGAHSVTREHLDEMVANFSRRSAEPFVDYDHSSIYRGVTRAAGWIEKLEVRDDGLYASMPRWTSAASSAIKDREYRYLSPVYLLQSEDKQGNPTGAFLHSVALTNDPYFDEGEIDSIGNSRPALPHTQPSKTIMERDEIIKQLGLEEGATDEQVKAALADAKQAREAAAKAAETESTEAKETAETEAGGDGQAGDASALELRIKSIEDNFKKQAEAAEEEKAEALVDGAVASGKIRAAEKGIYLNAARRDFAGTKKALDERKANSALPGRLQVDPDQKPGAKVNARQSLVDHLKAQRAAA